MRESKIESYLVEQCELIGIACPKFVSPGTAGVNDRLAIPQYGMPVWFIETKAPDGELEPLQAYWRRQIEQRGQRYALLDTKARVDAWIVQRLVEMHAVEHRARV